VKLCLQVVDDHVSRERPAVAVSVTTGEMGTTVTICDNGSGVPDEELRPLSRRDETPLKHGTGMGLWVVAWIIERIDATLTYEASSGGTVFTVRFPRRVQS
jgi:signal transduction histidine kinase